MNPTADEYESQFQKVEIALAADPEADLAPIFTQIAGWAEEPRLRFLVEALSAQIVAMVYADRVIRVQDYLAQFPVLRDHPELCRQLLMEKLRVETDRVDRARTGGSPPVASAGPAPPALAHFEGNWALLGGGGQGRVWRGHHRLLDRDEAVKILHRTDTPSADVRGVTEARALGRLHHPNVCGVYGYEVGLDNRPVLRMQFIDGQRANEWVAAEKTANNWSGADKGHQRIAELLASVADGLAAIHAAGWIHADIKPSNILVTTGGIPVIVDFGWACRPGPLDNRITGTAAYSPPEQRGRVAVEARSDVYSLGVTLWELVTGCVPKGSLAFPPEQKWPADLVAIVEKATAAEPEERYASATQMAHDLRLFANGKGNLVARPDGPLKRVGRAARAQIIPLTILAVTALLVVGLWSALQRHREQLQRAERDAIVNRLEEGWRAQSHTEADLQAAEADLNRLAELDAETAENHRIRYVDVLLSKQELDLNRVEQTVQRVAEGGESALARLRSPIRTTFLRQRVAGEEQYEVLEYVFRGNQNRIEWLKRAVNIQDIFGPTPGRPGVRLALVRSYMAAGQNREAAALLAEILARPDVLPAWRILVIRDTVWLAISTNDKDHQQRLLDQLNSEQYRKAPDEYREEYYELAVEEARLLIAAGKPNDARTVLDKYLARNNLDLVPKSPQTSNKRLPEGPTRANVPTSMFVEAATLRGFLPNDPLSKILVFDTPSVPTILHFFLPNESRKIWKSGYQLVQRTPSGTSYEAALLGSLSEELSREDAEAMMVSTAESTGKLSPVTAKMRALATNEGALEFVNLILREAWNSKRGRRMAYEIATRTMPFDQFTHAQVRLWIYEGLSLLTLGSHEAVEQNTDADAVLWAIAENLRDDWAKGNLKENAVVKLMDFAMETLAAVNSWPQVANDLPERLRGPIACVLGYACLSNRRLHSGARTYFDYARDHADASPHPDALKRLVQAGRKDP